MAESGHGSGDETAADPVAWHNHDIPQRQLENVQLTKEEAEALPVSREDSFISVEIKSKKKDMQENEISQPGEDVEKLKVAEPQGGTDSGFHESTKSAIKNEKTLGPPPTSHKKRKPGKKGIFFSYSPDAAYLEKKFVVETVRQLKENNLAEDIWFDKDEKNIDAPTWFTQRLEAVEKCRAAILILSDSYFQSTMSLFEGKVLLERTVSLSKPPQLFLVLYSPTDIPPQYAPFLDGIVDLTSGRIAKSSLAEKSSMVVGSLSIYLEKLSTAMVPALPPLVAETEFTGQYKKTKLCQWTVNDVQEWLAGMKVREFFCQAFAENGIDGFLLMALTEQDMVSYLSIESRIVRKKILSEMVQILDNEQKLRDGWHLRVRLKRPRVDTVYLVYDPADVRLAQNMKADLLKKNIQVDTHDKLGQSKEEFLQINAPRIAGCKNILVLLTEAAATSPFVFNEVVFAEWLNRTIVTALFKNMWCKLRPAMKAILGENPAIDFETKMYTDSMDVLEHQVRPLRKVSGIVLEQAYLNRMAEGLKPLQVLAAPQSGQIMWPLTEYLEPKVFISYQWDTQARVDDIRTMLESSGVTCWADISPVTRGHSSMSSRNAALMSRPETSGEPITSQIQRNMRACSVVICCITPKYIQSDNCSKDLTLAETLYKPIIPLMLRFLPWPPEGAPTAVRKILAKLSTVDLSTEKLFKQNFYQVLERVKKHLQPAKS
ncbi:Hypp1518 [Branchiostoma lanceolatum]|uniref:NAD(+) hydrolase SARM1 n=1 Tax=Branchiostoma lanceolatum TaxID=7740 RepID=A0A8J9ZM00_BRALA|nr:Hypp1518 [Branchiostoma lanceolatum]